MVTDEQVEKALDKEFDGVDCFEIVKTLLILKASHDKLVEAIQGIDNWAEAYPLEVFPELTKDNWKQAAEVLKANGLSIDRISASNMRHVLNGIKDTVKKALKEAEKI